MKIQKYIKITACFILICCMAVVFSACSGKAVTVTINDCGTQTEIQTKTGVKISEAIEEGGIKLGEKDETEPGLDETVKEDTTEITIKRYAKVTVVKGNIKKEVELVGGTVEDAIKKAELTLSDTDTIDAEKTAYLKDGMTINITEAIKVTLTADGKTNEISTNAADVKSFLDEQKIVLGKDDTCSEKMETKLKSGMKIVVKRVTYKEEKKTESVDYETEEEYSDSMNQGESEVTQKGAEGEKEIVYTVKYVDGKEESREKKSEKVTKAPVNEVITYGTKVDTPQSNNSNGGSESKADSDNSQSSSGGKTIVSKTPIYDCDGSGHGYYHIIYSDGTSENEDF